MRSCVSGHVPSGGAPAHRCVSGPDAGGGEAGGGLDSVSQPGEKVPRGSGCVPPAGDCVGAQIVPISGVKAERSAVSPAILSEVSRSGFRLCPLAVRGGEAIVTCFSHRGSAFSQKREIG